MLSDEETMDSEQANYYCAVSADTKQEIISSYSTVRQSLTIRKIRQRDIVHTESETMRKKKAMKKTLLFAIISTLLIGIVGCASNSDAAGQALSGVLMGIGQGLSGL